MATVELKPVSDLFGYEFFVPSYQRGYRWTNVQVQELLEDLFDFAEERHRDACIGYDEMDKQKPYVFKQSGNTERFSWNDVITKALSI